MTHTRITQVCLVASCLVANVLDAVIDVLISFREARGRDALVGLLIGHGD